MRLKIKNSSGSLCCVISYDAQTWFESAVPCPYDKETAAYAACRLIRHCPPVRDRLIWAAVRRGLTVGKGARPRQVKIKTTAEALAMEGGAAWIYLTVGQGCLTLRGVRVTAR